MISVLCTAPAILNRSYAQCADLFAVRSAQTYSLFTASHLVYFELRTMACSKPLGHSEVL